MRLISVVFYSLIFTTVVFGQEIPLDRVDVLAKSTAWLRLLHYRSGWFHGPRSQLAGREFFLHPEGDTDPRAEMLATLAAFTQDRKIGSLKQPPACAFPERLHFLKTELNLDFPKVRCVEFDAFVEKLNAASVSLVFSSAHRDNPGSMFGHTFLRLNSKASAAGGKKLDLLDWGISYAAYVPADENGFAFLWNGLLGGYPGRFSLLPYYAKINEYVNAESRDIWEYELNLNEEQTLRLVRHVWEVETTSYFPYYFLDENCAYQILALLEVANPDWDFNGIGLYVIPAETVKQVARIPGAIKEITFRPSLRKKFFHAFGGLNEIQKNHVLAVVAQGADPNVLSDAPSLDTATQFLFLKKQKNEGKFEEPDSRLFQKLALQRSTVVVDSEADRTPESSLSQDVTQQETRPDKGHGPSLISASSGARIGAVPRSFFELHFKPALHDLLNDETGYSSYLQIDLGSTRLRYFPAESQIYLDSIDIVAATSLFPSNRLEKKLSWSLRLDYYTPRDIACTDCHLARFEGGGGYASELISKDLLLYGLVLAKVEAGSGLAQGWRFGPHVHLGLIAHPLRRYHLQLAVHAVFDLIHGIRPLVTFPGELLQSWSFSQNMEARLQLMVTPGPSIYEELKASVNYYF